MARIIAEAGVRLVVDRKGLGLNIRRAIREAVLEASGDRDLFEAIDRDSERSARNVNRTWSRVLGGLRSALAGVVGGVALTGKLLLLGTAAAGALAGVASLTTGILALGQALVQASGVAALLPAILAGIVAVNATLKIGLSGVSDAFKALGEDAAAFEEAIKDLAPEAQQFMRSIRQMKPAFDQLRIDVQNRLFQNLSQTVEELGRQYLPLANRLFVSMAGSLNDAGKELGSFLSRGATVNQVTGIVDNLRGAWDILTEAIRPAFQALLDITDVGSTFLPGFADTIRESANEFANFIKEAARTGELKQFIQDAIDTLKTLGRIAGNVFGIIGNVMDGANTSGVGLLTTIENITQRIEDWTGSFGGQVAIATFFSSLKRAADALWPAIQTLVEVFLRDFVPILADIASIIGPVLAPLFAALGKTLQALRPLIDAIAQAFSKVLAALEPVFEAIGKAVTDAMPALQPIIDDIADAFVNLIESMVPLIPLFFDLLEALLPIIPPFLQMIADLMPRFIQLIEALMPYVELFARSLAIWIPIFTDIVDFLLGVFIPVIGFIANVFTGIANVILTVVQFIWNIITTVFSAIGTFLGNIWESISSGIGNQWRRIQDFVTNGISDIIGRIGRWAGDMVGKAKDMMSRFVNAIVDGIKNVVQWFKDLPGRVFSAIGDFVGRLVQLGRDLIQGLIDGIKAMVRRVVDAVTGVITDALNAAKALLGISSPSKVFREIGINVGQGMVQGLKKITPAVAGAAQDMVDFATSALADPLSANIGLNGGPLAGTGTAAAIGGTIINQTNVMRQGTDVKQFSDLVLGRTMGDYLSGASTLTVARSGVQAGVNDQWAGV